MVVVLRLALLAAELAHQLHFHCVPDPQPHPIPSPPLFSDLQAPAGRRQSAGARQLALQPQITAVVTDRRSRTPQDLYAAITGLPVVKPAWVLACAAAKKQLPMHSQHLWLPPAAPGGPAAANVFAGLRVHLHGARQFTEPFGQLLQHAGGWAGGMLAPPLVCLYVLFVSIAGCSHHQLALTARLPTHLFTALCCTLQAPPLWAGWRRRQGVAAAYSSPAAISCCLMMTRLRTPAAARLQGTCAGWPAACASLCMTATGRSRWVVRWRQVVGCVLAERVLGLACEAPQRLWLPALGRDLLAQQHSTSNSSVAAPTHTGDGATGWLFRGCHWCHHHPCPA